MASKKFDLLLYSYNISHNLVQKNIHCSRKADFKILGALEASGTQFRLQVLP
jgi:hypothetical protein